MNKLLRKNLEASRIFIFITVLLDAIGIGIIIPIMPEIIKRFGTDPQFVSTYFGYFISVYAFMQFIASPFLGALSDKFGRRLILLVSLFGTGVDYLLMAFAPSLTILFLGRVISGLTGANQTVASSYMADISDDSNRAKNFGLIGAAFGIGFVVGPALGGFVGSFGHHYPFIVAAIMAILNFLFGLFILPESLPIESRREIEISKINPINSFRDIKKRPELFYYFVLFGFVNLAGQVHPSIWTLYTTYKFHWTSVQVGFSLTAVGLALGIGQGFFTGIFTKHFKEMNTFIFGTVVATLSYFLYAIATETWMVYAIISLIMLSVIAPPALQSLVAKEVPANEQGELQGTLFSIISLTSIVAPLLYTKLFSVFTENPAMQFPGAPYLAAMFISLICLLLILYKTKLKA